MKIIADESIPALDYFFQDQGELILKNGRMISSVDLKSADILLTRSVTQVNQSLLENSSIKFVGSTVAGLDHLDANYLNASGIKWFAAEGCNAMAVAEYVVCVVAALQKQNLLIAPKLRAAVIGVGRVGQFVVEKLKQLNIDVLTCDPFRKDGPAFNHTDIQHIQDCDLICLHTPLTMHGDFPTYHLIEKTFLQRQKSGAVLLNAGRGAVIHFNDLQQFGNHLHWCFDVFENEPHVDFNIVKKAKIATPHIAGHTLQSKIRGVEMVYEFAIANQIIAEKSIKTFKYPDHKISLAKNTHWRDFVLGVFDPAKLTEAFQLQSDLFDSLRKDLHRHEFAFVESVL